ncbi:hypothetical protein AMTRI_Chr01g131280 [Amborella trichopoda]
MSSSSSCRLRHDHQEHQLPLPPPFTTPLRLFTPRGLTFQPFFLTLLLAISCFSLTPLLGLALPRATSPLSRSNFPSSWEVRSSTLAYTASWSSCSRYLSLFPCLDSSAAPFLVFLPSSIISLFSFYPTFG